MIRAYYLPIIGLSIPFILIHLTRKPRTLVKDTDSWAYPRITESEVLRAGLRNLFLTGASCISDVKSALGITGLSSTEPKKALMTPCTFFLSWCTVT